jgi:NAD(P)H-hydrate repair Nnr-like enzyme with NAD(P)H-hydrate epimerase domain
MALYAGFQQGTEPAQTPIAYIGPGSNGGDAVGAPGRPARVLLAASAKATLPLWDDELCIRAWV